MKYVVCVLGLSVAVASPALARLDICATGTPGGFTEVVSDAHFIGYCDGSKSSGLGVVTMLDAEGKEIGAFYGEIDTGEYQLGVIERKGGFKVVDNRPVPADDDGMRDAQSRLDAFRMAQKGAQKAADEFVDSNNSARAAHFADKARMLAEQLGN